MAIVLNQMFHYSLNPNIKNLYYKGKGYELLSLFFNKNEDPNIEQCPFLIDEENVQKIKPNLKWEPLKLPLTDAL